MNLDELNRKLRWFAERGLACDERVWFELNQAWRDGYSEALKDLKRPDNEAYKDKNPFRVRS